MTTEKMDYKLLLESNYAIDIADSGDSDYTRSEFLCMDVFGILTYDSDMDRLFATKISEVCEAISNNETMKYIEEPENYKWYLIVVNLPFVVDKINWGTSIRGSWWDYDKGTFVLNLGSWLYKGKELSSTESFTRDQWIEFTHAIYEFMESERNADETSNG